MKPRTGRKDSDSAFCYAAPAAVTCGNTDKPDEVKSPSKSPTKKKARRQQDSLLHFDISNYPEQEDDDVSDDMPDCTEPRRLFASSSTTPADKKEVEENHHQQSGDF